jgi:hypothetical protein
MAKWNWGETGGLETGVEDPRQPGPGGSATPRFSYVRSGRSRQQQTQRTLLDWLRVEFGAKEEG